MGVMQRKLLATAVASACALPAAALAQVPSWIQIYGRANVTYERITTKNSSDTVTQKNQSNWDLVDNSSRIGFRGNKDLGGGLTGLFQFESRVRLDTGNGVLTGRDSYAGAPLGAGTTPSWMRNPYMSTTSQCSAMRPSRNWWMSMPWMV